MALSKLTAAVLVGGHSRRMGEPKALLRLGPDGPTMVERIVGAVAEVADEVILVGRVTWSLPESLRHLPCVVDAGGGAADGVVAALRAARHRFCLVVACDMPFLDPDLLRRMADAALERGQGVILADDRGDHPLHAVYRTADLDRIESLVGSGERSLTTIAESVGMHRLPEDVEGVAARAEWSAFNVNTPDDLMVARRHVEESELP